MHGACHMCRVYHTHTVPRPPNIHFLIAHSILKNQGEDLVYFIMWKWYTEGGISDQLKAFSYSLCPSSGVLNICKTKNFLWCFRNEAHMQNGGALGMRLMVKTIKILVPRSPPHGLGTRQGVNTECMQWPSVHEELTWTLSKWTSSTSSRVVMNAGCKKRVENTL